MPQRDIFINLKPVANTYRSKAADERIIEVSSKNGGCLISFRLVEGHLIIEPYRMDDTVRVVGVEPEKKKS